MKASNRPVAAISFQAISDQKFLLNNELDANNFNLIRFSSYRTAQKLRFVQKKLSLHLIDIWNVIESFRENGLNALSSDSELSTNRLDVLLKSLFLSLNKRIPLNEQVSVDECSSSLLHWLYSVYSSTPEKFGKIKVFSVKVALTTLCVGKLVDKLKYIFSQISDNDGVLVKWKFSEYLRDVLELPGAVFESPSFSYNEQLVESVFEKEKKVTVKEFLDVMINNETASRVLIWLRLMNRIEKAESYCHTSECNVCKKSDFFGFKYKCQKCAHYVLCQDCFWKGLVNPPHLLEHQVKEYSTSKTANKNLSNTLRKSFRCVPDNGNDCVSDFTEHSEQKLNLTHIVPPSPLLAHNGFTNTYPHQVFDNGTIDSRCTNQSSENGKDDEHYLIARYAAKLAEQNCSDIDQMQSKAFTLQESAAAQKDLISQLETRNKEIMSQISKLKKNKEENNIKSPELSKLKALRMRKDDLETHLQSLQDSRKNLMGQLETLMRMLKNSQITSKTMSSSHSNLNSPQTSARGAIRLASAENPGARSKPSSSAIIEPLPDSNHFYTSNENKVNSNGVHSPSSLRNDLLIAADSVTNAMSSLVKELNSPNEFGN